MHLRKLGWVCGFAVAVLANYASALGLGEIKLNSALNQPLDAEIKLLDVRDLSADQVIVALGSPADFERNGVDRLYFYTELEFQILLDQPGGAIVRLTTRNPVREPYLNFLVEARWPSGRLLREYTLLMDLPTFDDAPATPVESATTYPQTISQPSQRPTVQTPPRSATPSYSQTDSSPTTSEPASGGRRAGSDSYGPVSSNETLWQIALDTRPDRGLSVHQTMLAIQRLNPDAFINGNINLLRQGQVLRLPSADEIRSMSRRDAVEEVAVQNREWSENTMGAQLNASRREVSTRRESEEVSGQVKLAAPGSETGYSGQGSGSNAGDSRGLENELASTLEELDKARLENSDLNSRIRDLEEQIDTMERLVDVSNEQLRAMQLAASQEQAVSDPVPQTPPETQDSFSSISEEAASSEAAPVIEPEVAVSEPEPEVIPPEQTPPARDVTKIIPAAPKPKTIVDHIIDNALWIGIGLLVILIAAYAIIRRRNENALEEESAQDDDIFSMPATDNTYDEESYEEYPVEPVDEDMPLFDEDDAPAEAETGDAVAEADIYIAYGKFDQAEEMLLNALAKEPSSVPIRMKLLEVYSQIEDVDKFDQQYASLLGDANHSDLHRAAELRESIPGAGDFDSGLDLTPQEDEAIDLSSSEDTIDFGLDDDLYSEPTKTSKQAATDDDFNFDLDLDDEPPAPLSLGQTLSRESDLGVTTTRYDLSFDDDQVSDSSDSEEEFSLELEDDFVETKDEVLLVKEDEELEDDLGELSFELDEPVSTKPASVSAEQTLADDEEFNFDFDDSEPEAATEETPAVREEKAAAVDMTDDGGDDFNPDMDMSDLDLEALDHEMESLDAEFGETDNQAFVDLNSELEAEFDAPAKSAEELEDDVFEQAMSELPEEETEGAPAVSGMSDDDIDAELDFLADTDEAATKLDLARAYIDMGDADGARDILAEVVQEGNAQQREEAEGLLSRIDA